MSRFPGRRYLSAAEYLDDYTLTLASALSGIDRAAFSQSVSMLIAALERDATIFVCGNGGSAAIANHLVCDHQKGIHTGTSYRPRIISLSSNVELITAVGNDIGYTETFSFPLSLHGRQGDLLITISSSGNSENIVRALRVAQGIGMERISLTGFEGGRSKNMADVNIHVPAHNYGVIEDTHQVCMHIFAQYIRQAAMDEEKILGSAF